jgi:hypothetical protein
MVDQVMVRTRLAKINRRRRVVDTEWITGGDNDACARLVYFKCIF